MAGAILGWRTVCAVELDAGARRILLDRQRDGSTSRYPIWDDVQTFDGFPWRGSVDVITGGFPCQDISQCGKGAGINGARSGLWREMARIIGEVRPRLIVVENSPMLLTRGLDRVLADLAGLGMDARWGLFRASAIGAAHHRCRIYMVAYPHGQQLQGMDFPPPRLSDSAESRRGQLARAIDAALPVDDYAAMPRDPHDVARGMDGLKATGNGWVPAMAARAIRTLLSHPDARGDLKCG